MPDTLKVSCYSGHTFAQEPRSFHWQGVEYQVAEIEKAWQEPSQRCFRVRTDFNKHWQLCYNEVYQEWSLVDLVR